MRNLYHEKLSELAEQLGRLCGLAGSEMERATRALLRADMSSAEQVINDHDRMVALCARAEESAVTLLALQQPVAGELRSIVSWIQITSDLDRMDALAVHVAKIARLRHPDHVLPIEIEGLFTEIGRVAVKLANRAQEVVLTPTPDKAACLREQDDEMDELHRRLFSVLLDPHWQGGIESAIDVTLCGRYYERFCDHAVSVARRVIYLVTGERVESVEA